MKLRALLALLSVGLVHADTPAPTEQPAAGASTIQRGEREEEWQLRVKTNNEYAHELGDRINIIFDGDSITDFWRSKGEAIWNDRYAKLGAYDFGISGDRTENVLWRISKGQLDGLKPKLVALMIGSNNVESSDSPEKITRGVRRIVDAYQKACPDATILIQGILPLGELPTDPLREKIATTNEMISKLADGKKVLYTDFSDRFINPDGTLSKDTLGDFVHPTAKGYQIWAEALEPVISETFPTMNHPMVHNPSEEDSSVQ